MLLSFFCNEQVTPQVAAATLADTPLGGREEAAQVLQQHARARGVAVRIVYSKYAADGEATDHDHSVARFYSAPCISTSHRRVLRVVRLRGGGNHDAIHAPFSLQSFSSGFWRDCFSPALLRNPA